MSIWLRDTISQKYSCPRWIIIAMNALLVLTALAATAVLILYHGFRTAPVEKHWLEIASATIMGIFVADRVARLIMARRRWSYFRDNWIDIAIIALAGVALALAGQFYDEIFSAGTLYVVITQTYMLMALVVHGLKMNMRFAGSGVHPAWLFIGGFAIVCLGGAGLLMLPAAINANYDNWYFPDALFTAVSATCVTGLTVKDTGTHFTPFGQAVILAMIQIGGFGIILFGTVMAFMVGKGMSVRGANALGQMMGQEGVGKVGRSAIFIVMVTFLMEIVGAMLLYPMFSTIPAPGTREIATPAQAVWNSVFHSVSAFCNAGFSLYRDNFMQGSNHAGNWNSAIRDHWQMLGVIAPLIILGGIGFPVIQDCWDYFKAMLRRRFGKRQRTRGDEPANAFPKLSLHTKTVVSTTLVLIFLGASVLLIMERPDASRAVEKGTVTGLDARTDWQTMDPAQRMEAAIFQSVSARTAGYNTMDIGQMSSGGKFWMCMLMLVGGSPGSAAGGMKTTTLAILIAAVWSALNRRKTVELNQRSIAAELFHKVVTLATMYLSLVALITMALCIAMPQFAFIDLMFESCSACGTVGLTAGVTPSLTIAGKYIIIAGMFIGRIGPLMLLWAISATTKEVKYEYPNEGVMIG